MATKVLVILSLFLLPHISQVINAETSNDDLQNFAEMAAQLLQSQGTQGLGSMVQGLMGGAFSDGGADSNTAGNIGQVLKGLGNLVAPNSGGLNGDVLSGVLDMIGNSVDPQKKDNGLDVASILSTVGGFLSQPGNSDKLEQIASFAPMVLDFMNAMNGPEAHERELKHSEHSWSYPPIFERMHVLIDHFVNSDFGRKIMENIGSEKFFKLFADDNGQFSYDKFVELMENLSFRRHWIHMLTLKMGKVIEYYSDPKIYEPYVVMGQFVINGYLTKQGFPKTAHLNSEKPVKSISGLVDYSAKKYLGAKIDSKYYVEPVMSYALQIVSIAKKEGLSRGGAEGISAKLADSINLEIIEPIARVNRAYRYLKKNPKCDKYVLCLINQKGPESSSFPGLKLLLSKGTSLLASWALNEYSNRSVMDYFNIIMYENQCQNYFNSDCSDYHDEEIKVTTEYIHNEL